MELAICRAWYVECQRCANEGTSFEADQHSARVDFYSRGWADDMCPACNRSLR